MIKLYTFLENKRKELNLSLRKAAEIIGVSHSYLSNLEKGVDPRSGAPINPTPETLKLIAKAYNIDYDLLLEYAGYLHTKEDTLDVEKEAQRMIDNLEKSDVVEFCGQPADEEDKEFLKMAYEKFLTDIRYYKRIKKIKDDK